MTDDEAGDDADDSVDSVDSVDSDSIVAGLARPTDWRAMPAAKRKTAWRELRAWVEWFVCRYGLDVRVVPPCWYLHPALVDLLTALHDQHRSAHHHLSRGGSPASWQLTFLQLEPRLRDWTARTGCTRDTHRDEPAITWPDDAARWQQHTDDDTNPAEVAPSARPLVAEPPHGKESR